MEQEYRSPTKFNMAIATLENMHNLLKLCIVSSLQGDFLQWYENLKALRRDIACFITDDEFKEIEKKFQEIDSTNWIQISQKNKKRGVNPGKISFVYNCLDDITIYIRKAMNNAGLLMPKSDDPRFALEM